MLKTWKNMSFYLDFLINVSFLDKLAKENEQT